MHEIANHKLKAFLLQDINTANISGYQHFLVQMYVVYKALESELENHCDNPFIGPVHFPEELNRLRYLEMDLDFYYHGEWRDDMESYTTDAARRWVNRIHKVAKTQPELLLVYSYTRYFTEMGGGPILDKMIKKRYS